MQCSRTWAWTPRRRFIRRNRPTPGARLSLPKLVPGSCAARRGGGRATRCPEHVQACRAQHFAQANHRQPHQRGRIISVHALEERAPEALRSESTRAVKRLLARNIGLDVVRREGPELDREPGNVELCVPVRDVEHREPGAEFEPAAVGHLQLGDIAGMVAGFAEHRVVEKRDLIGTITSPVPTRLPTVRAFSSDRRRTSASGASPSYRDSSMSGCATRTGSKGVRGARGVTGSGKRG